MSIAKQNEMRRFGEKLHTLRTDNKLTLKELAAALGLKAHGYLSELEAGKKAPTAEFALAVAHLFHTTTDQLLKDERELSPDVKPKKAEERLTLAFVDRNPTFQEVERLRLILSTYQDGTGMLVTKNNATLPGWRDFERAVALTFSGKGSENKAVFDVLLTDESKKTLNYGLSCKMRKELNRIQRDGRVTLELSNSSGQFWDQLTAKGISATTYRNHCSEVGQTLIEQVNRWHLAASVDGGGSVDLTNSFYLVLSWNSKGLYQLHQFPLNLPDPQTLRWYFPTKQTKESTAPARRINGDDERGTVFEWYGESGGQLKYYPEATSAIWQSDTFRLEPLPDIEFGVLSKVSAYFPKLWSDANQ